MVLSFLAGGLGAFGQITRAADDRPDIIVIMVDDLGFIPDDRVLKRLPNIRKQFLNKGVRVKDMYTETPLCCPARAAFLTGQHTLNHGVTLNDGDLLDPTTTINVALRDQGYHTMMVGKYLNSYSGPKVPPGWDSVDMMASEESSKFWIDGASKIFGTRWSNDIIRSRAGFRLRAAPTDKPVFSWVSFRAPHVCGRTKRRKRCFYQPLVMKRDRGAPECRGIDKFRPPSYRVRTHRFEVRHPMPPWRTGWKLRTVCESMLVVDRTVKRLVEIQKGRGRPAYFIFMSDNGMSWGQKGFTFKQVPTASRLPFYVKGPGIQKGQSMRGLVSNIDIAPTMAKMAGIGFGSADGKSFLSGLKGDAFTPRSELLMVMPRSHPNRYQGWNALIAGRWFLIEWEDGTTWLYDRWKDRWLRENLSATMPDKRAQLSEQLSDAIQSSIG